MLTCSWCVYIRLNVCIMYSQYITGIQYPSLARIIHTTHLTVVEGAPSSRNLGKAVCVLCFICCTHSLSGVLFQSVVNKHGTKVSGLHVCKSLYEAGDLLLGDHLTHQSK